MNRRKAGGDVFLQNKNLVRPVPRASNFTIVYGLGRCESITSAQMKVNWDIGDQFRGSLWLAEVNAVWFEVTWFALIVVSSGVWGVSNLLLEWRGWKARGGVASTHPVAVHFFYLLLLAQTAFSSFSSGWFRGCSDLEGEGQVPTFYALESAPRTTYALICVDRIRLVT